MPEYFVSGTPVTIKWKVMGYHEGYYSTIAFFNCNDAPNSCGNSYSQNFHARNDIPYTAKEVSGWTYSSGTNAYIFSYEYTFTPPVLGNTPTDIVIRFYNVSDVDRDAGKSGLSLLVPGATAQRYTDTSGRRITKTILPSWNSVSYMALDVPYLDQLDIPDIGLSACSSASAAMVLAYHGKIQRTTQNMMDAAISIFGRTAGPYGLEGRDGMTAELTGNWGFSSADFDQSYQPQLYETIKAEIRAGRPMILGTRSATSAGHYLVVIGYDGNDYSTGKVVVNDPNGEWKGYMDGYNTDLSGKHVKYDFTDLTAQLTDGVFIIRP
jgi:hypothetical protein